MGGAIKDIWIDAAYAQSACEMLVRIVGSAKEVVRGIEEVTPRQEEKLDQANNAMQVAKDHLLMATQYMTIWSETIEQTIREHEE